LKSLGISERADAPDQVDILQKLARAQCRLPLLASFWTAHLTVHVDSRSGRREAILRLRDLEELDAPELIRSIAEPAAGDWPWETLVERVVRKCLSNSRPPAIDFEPSVVTEVGRPVFLHAAIHTASTTRVTWEVYSCSDETCDRAAKEERVFERCEQATADVLSSSPTPASQCHRPDSAGLRVLASDPTFLFDPALFSLDPQSAETAPVNAGPSGPRPVPQVPIKDNAPTQPLMDDNAATAASQNDRKGEETPDRSDKAASGSQHRNEDTTQARTGDGASPPHASRAGSDALLTVALPGDYLVLGTVSADGHEQRISQVVHVEPLRDKVAFSAGSNINQPGPAFSISGYHQLMGGQSVFSSSGGGFGVGGRFWASVHGSPRAADEFVGPAIMSELGYSPTMVAVQASLAAGLAMRLQENRATFRGGALGSVGVCRDPFVGGVLRRGVKGKDPTSGYCVDVSFLAPFSQTVGWPQISISFTYNRR
jgi:hypothetical protein